MLCRLLACLAVVGGCCNAGRSANRTWKKTVPLPARGPLQMPGALKPNVVEAHAMELIKSMLYLADTTGQLTQAALQRQPHLVFVTVVARNVGACIPNSVWTMLT